MTAPSRNPAPRWTREQIRDARLVPIVPILQRRGLQLRERDAGNYDVDGYPGLIVKDSYWRWPQHNLAQPSPEASARPGGNAIDFCVRILGLSLHDAMREITRP